MASTIDTELVLLFYYYSIRLPLCWTKMMQRWIFWGFLDFVWLGYNSGAMPINCWGGNATEHKTAVFKSLMIFHLGLKIIKFVSFAFSKPQIRPVPGVGKNVWIFTLFHKRFWRKNLIRLHRIHSISSYFQHRGTHVILLAIIGVAAVQNRSGPLEAASVCERDSFATPALFQQGHLLNWLLLFNWLQLAKEAFVGIPVSGIKMTEPALQNRESLCCCISGRTMSL